MRRCPVQRDSAEDPVQCTTRCDLALRSRASSGAASLAPASLAPASIWTIPVQRANLPHQALRPQLPPGLREDVSPLPAERRESACPTAARRRCPVQRDSTEGPVHDRVRPVACAPVESGDADLPRDGCARRVGRRRPARRRVPPPSGAPPTCPATGAPAEWGDAYLPVACAPTESGDADLPGDGCARGVERRLPARRPAPLTQPTS